MARDPSPKADQLRAQREARMGHLQATVEPTKPPKPRPHAGKVSKKPKPRGEKNANA